MSTPSNLSPQDAPPDQSPDDDFGLSPSSPASPPPAPASPPSRAGEASSIIAPPPPPTRPRAKRGPYKLKSSKKLKSTAPRINPLPASSTIPTDNVIQSGSIPPIDPGDGSIPLNNPRFERMTQLRVSGYNQTDCYKATSKSKCSNEAAKVGSSKIFARPDVRSRLNWLSMQAKNVPKEPKTTTKRQPQTTDTQPSDNVASRQSVLVALSQALAKGTTGDIVQAGKALLAAMPAEDDGKDAQPDPSAFTSWLAQIAGTAGPDIVQAIGGVRFVADRICAALNLSRDELKAML